MYFVHILSIYFVDVNKYTQYQIQGSQGASQHQNHRHPSTFLDFEFINCPVGRIIPWKLPQNTPLPLNFRTPPPPP